jgi:hypothetical protein
MLSQIETAFDNPPRQVRRAGRRTEARSAPQSPSADLSWAGSASMSALDDHAYWAIHPVINRKPRAEAGWDDEDEDQRLQF